VPFRREEDGGRRLRVRGARRRLAKAGDRRTRDERGHRWQALHGALSESFAEALRALAGGTLVGLVRTLAHVAGRRSTLLHARPELLVCVRRARGRRPP